MMVFISKSGLNIQTFMNLIKKIKIIYKGYVLLKLNESDVIIYFEIISRIKLPSKKF